MKTVTMSPELHVAYETLLSVAEEAKNKPAPHWEVNLVRAVEDVHRLKEYQRVSVQTVEEADRKVVPKPATYRSPWYEDPRASIISSSIAVALLFICWFALMVIVGKP